MRALRWLAPVLTAFLIVILSPAAADADPKIPIPVLPDIPLSPPEVPGISDCKQAPVPDSPGNGIAGFFAGRPQVVPPAEDPFATGSSTTIYEQYGYAGLRWRNYDLGCGPDAMRNPDAVIGTAVSNWIMQAPLALTALTGSLTEVAFNPTFLDTFNPVVERVSTALHENLFATWIPAVLALLGLLIIFMARRSALASTAAAIGWAVIVVILATALFRWPIVAGNAADATVAATIGEAVGRLDGDATNTDPGVAVASQAHEAILYRSWLAGTLGSPDSATAKKYGPDLFKAQALTWREAAEAQKDPERAKQIIEAKQKDWSQVAEKIRTEDPEAYENLTGGRSETRVGYAVLAALGIFLSLPFLLLSALLMLGCFFIVRLAVMLFPAFAILGIFPNSRGIVTGLGRTVAAAVVNAIIFGIGAGVTVAVLGILFHPGGGAPGWLSLVLMPLFSFIMWHALKPFRRLTTMVNPEANHFGDMHGSMSKAKRTGMRRGKQVATTGAAAVTGGATGAAVMAAMDDDEDRTSATPDRAEARPSPRAPTVTPFAPEAAPGWVGTDGSGAQRNGGPRVVSEQVGAQFEARPGHHRGPQARGPEPAVAALPEGFVPRPTSEGLPLPPTEPEWDDGEAVYPIYRPSDEHTDDVA
jgi:uncharacterized membrane protein